MPSSLPFTESLRRAAKRCPKSGYAICKETGIDKAALSRFLAGKSGLSLRAVDRLCVAVGARLVVEQRNTSSKALKGK